MPHGWNQEKFYDLVSKTLTSQSEQMQLSC